MNKTNISEAAEIYVSDFNSTEAVLGTEETREFGKRDFTQGAQWLVKSQIQECEEQIALCESGKENYKDDADQVAALNNIITYHNFMITRLKRFL